MIIRFELSTEFTRWKQRLDARNAASTGMKPVESLAPHGMIVAVNYRPTGIKPVVAKAQQKTLHSVAVEGDVFIDRDAVRHFHGRINLDCRAIRNGTKACPYGQLA